MTAREHNFNFLLVNATNEIFQRTERLVGPDGMEAISQARVIVFGVGGVGSWCAESLVRTGVGHLTIVDSDCVSVSNINRQLMATVQTVGQPKVEVLRDRLLSINPEAEITALQKVYCEETADEFDLASYHYVIDAIDSLRDKVLLIRRATEARPATLFSSMGAALKMDPTQVRVAEFWKVKGCPLGAALRRRFKSSGQLPRRKFQCVFSEERLPNLGAVGTDDATALAAAQAYEGDAPALPPKAQINGSLAHITALFGFTLAGLVVQDIQRRACSNI